MVRFTAGVSTPYFNPRIGCVLEYASVWSIIKRVDVDVNALGDKQHGVGSLHPWGLAIDLDTAGDRPADLEALYGYLARYLPSDYDVLLELDHVHVEFDPHRRPTPLAPPATTIPLATPS